MTLTRNFVDGRGIEAMTVDDGTVTTTSYPLYDTHGNMIATVSKSSGGRAWNIGDERNTMPGVRCVKVLQPATVYHELIQCAESALESPDALMLFRVSSSNRYPANNTHYS